MTKYGINTLKLVAIIVLLWIAISTMIQAFKCNNMTQTQLFRHIPKSFVCDWINCNKEEAE